MREDIPAVAQRAGLPGAERGSCILLAVFFSIGCVKLIAYGLLLSATIHPERLLLYKAVVVPCVLCPILLLAFLPRRPWLLAGLAVLQFAYLYSTLHYYLQFYRFLRVGHVMALYREMTSFAATAEGPPWHPSAWILLLDAVPFLFVVSRYRQCRDWLFRDRAALRWGLAASLAGLTAAEGHNLANHKSVFNRIPSLGENILVDRYGTFLNGIMDLVRFPHEKNLCAKLRTGPVRSGAATGREPPNFVLIQVESFDVRVLEARYRGRAITPFLASLRETSAYFPYVVSHHLGGGSSDCDFSVLNSLPALEDYPAMKLRTYPFSNSLVARLRAMGYRTQAFHGNTRHYYDRGSAFARMGFEGFHDFASMGKRELGWGIPDAEVFDFAAGMLVGERDPFFYYLITLSSHQPYDHHASTYPTGQFPGIRDDPLRRYFEAMAYVDHEIRRFVERVSGRHPDTYFLIYGDHAAYLPENAFPPAGIRLDGNFLEFVPLFILTPARTARTARTESELAVSYLDIAPTILAVTGRGFRHSSWGQDLLSLPLARDSIPFRRSFLARGEAYQAARDWMRASAWGDTSLFPDLVAGLRTGSDS